MTIKVLKKRDKVGRGNSHRRRCQDIDKLVGLIDTTRMRGMSFLMVLIAVGAMAYQHKDGVWVVPIGCLKE